MGQFLILEGHSGLEPLPTLYPFHWLIFTLPEMLSKWNKAGISKGFVALYHFLVI